jgi:hypothetical protein
LNFQGIAIHYACPSCYTLLGYSQVQKGKQYQVCQKLRYFEHYPLLRIMPQYGLMKWYEKLVLARNPSSPFELLLELAQQGDPQVQYFLAQNPNLPPEGVISLAREESPAVLLQLAKNPKTPTATLMQLAQTLDADILNAIEQHPNANVEVKDAVIASRAARKLIQL